MIEAICLAGYLTKIPNYNTQITNNIKITNSNDQNITLTHRSFRFILFVLNFGHWYLFEPALARLDWHKPLSVLECQLKAINAVGVNPVWARDLLFGAWNFHDFDKPVALYIIHSTSAGAWSLFDCCR